MSRMTGSCNCGETRYEVRGGAKNVVNCHCGLCRKMNGAAFSTYAVVLESDFALLRGELKTYPVSGNATKSICSNCGTPIFNKNPKYEGLTILHLGSVDQPQHLAPQANLYCESQVGWLEEVAQLTSFDKGIK